MLCWVYDCTLEESVPDKASTTAVMLDLRWGCAPYLVSTLGVLVMLIGCQPAGAGEHAGEWLRLVAASQYERLISQAESNPRRATLDAAELHLLCYAYARTKHYGHLSACLNEFETRFPKSRGREGLLFGLEDALPHIVLMRAEAALDQGDTETALVAARRALQLLEQVDADPPVGIEAHALLALAAVRKGDIDLARAQLPALHKLGRSLFRDDYSGQRALALGKVYLALGEYALAHESLAADRTFRLDAFLDDLFSSALLRGESHWLWRELPRAYMMNRALLGMDRLEDAARGYDRLLEQAAVRQNGEIYWLAHYDRGLIAERQGDAQRAMQHYRLALEVIEAQRASIATEASKIGFVGDRQAVYTRLLRLQADNDMAEAAFETMERARARALVDLLARKHNLRARTGGEAAQRLLQAHQQAEQQQRLQYVARTHEPTDSAATVSRLRQIDPLLADLIAVTTPRRAALSARLGENERLLSYFIDGERLYIAVLDAAGVRLHRLAAPRLEQDVQTLRRAIRQRETPLWLLRGLYDQLVRPVGLEGGERLIVVPYGALHYLPFAALHDGRAHLVERHVISVLPSASLLALLPAAGPLDASVKALVLANPDLGSRRLDLPHTEAEAAAIRSHWSDARVLDRKAASEAAFKREAGSHGLLHLATHGEFNPEAPLHSGLLLAGGDGEDGRLSVNEIYDLVLDAELVGLSACETGLGRVASGDDVIGLTRGFLYAGARRILASLWPVDDAATARLMGAFYQGLARGQTVAQALALAQRSELQGGRAPYFWAAFQVTGR